MKNILFVCTGNTCRSSMAEAIFNEAVKEMSEEFHVKSAGTSAFVGDSASEEAIIAVKELYNIDLTAHRSSVVSEYLLEEADLVLTMTRGHKKILLNSFPQVATKVFTLKEYVREDCEGQVDQAYNYNLDIIDPYGMSVEVYKKTAREIREAIDKVINKL